MSVSAPLRPMRIEQYVSYLRVFGLVVGTPTLLLAGFTTPVARWLAWGIQAVLLVGTVALWVWRRHMRPADETAVMVAGFVLNAVVIGGYVLAFSHLQPDVSWAMVFTLIADAALRFGARGAALGWVLAGILFAAQAQAHEAMTGVATPPVAYLYVLGALAGAAGILAVFTTTMDRQAQLAQQQALALADANRVRERLLAMSSHEFRGSLAAVMMASETVRTHLDRLAPARVEALLAEVDRHGRNLSRLVDDLVALAQADSDAIQVRRRWDDLPASVEVALAAAERHRKGHAVSVSVEDVCCLLDHERFQQVVRNLVENSYKYAPPGSRVVVLAHHVGHDGVPAVHVAHGHPQQAGHRAHGAGAPRERIELRVADDGPGIPAADRDRIFEPFSRRRGAAADPESRGLGLYVVQQIVTAMEGSIALHSSPAGTEFVLTLPVELSAESAPGRPPGAAGPSGLGEPAHNERGSGSPPETRDSVRR